MIAAGRGPGSGRRRLVAAALALGLLAGCGGSGQGGVLRAGVSPTGVAAPGSGPVSATAGADGARASEVAALDPEPASLPELRRYYTQSARWSPCGDGFDCAQVRVPLDYAEPGGATLSLALKRLPAADAARRLGSLLINPGGPGGSGLELVDAAGQFISEGVRERYDIVGFDPRGVGSSDPVTCLTQSQLARYVALDATPDDDAEIVGLQRELRRLGQRCEDRAGSVLPHVGTPNVAQDLDVVRAVVGDEKLTYLGYSYGTYIGALYAGMFPTRVGRLVLDGAVDPTLTGQQLDDAQLAGFEEAFDRVARFCLDQAGCTLGRSVAEIRTATAELLLRLDSDPLRTSSGRMLSEAEALTGIASALYVREQWTALLVGIIWARQGNGDVLLELGDRLVSRDPDGRFRDNSNEVFRAINCLDHPGGPTREEIEAALPERRPAGPLFGETFAWTSLVCSTWPVQSDTRPLAVRASGAAPIVVVGTTGDPATPYAWSQALADQLDSGVLLTFEGDGHTAYGRGSACIDDAVDAYLIDGTPPEDGARCP